MREGEEEEDRGGFGGRGRGWDRSEGCSRSSLLPGRSPFFPPSSFFCILRGREKSSLLTMRASPFSGVLSRMGGGNQTDGPSDPLPPSHDHVHHRVQHPPVVLPVPRSSLSRDQRTTFPECGCKAIPRGERVGFVCRVWDDLCRRRRRWRAAGVA